MRREAPAQAAAKELIALDKAAPVKAVVLETPQNWIKNSPLDSIRMSAEFLKENL